MRRTRLLALVIVLLAVLVGPAQARTHRVATHRASAASAHRCSTRGLPGAVRTVIARDCARGRTVVREWFHRLKTPGGNACVVPDGSPGPAVCTVHGWRCTSQHTVNGSTYPVTCTAARGLRRVHFVNRV